MAKHKTDEEYAEAIRTSSSYANALRKLGLRPTGGNYATIHERINRLNIDTSHMTRQSWNKGERFRPFHKVITSNEIFSKGKYRSTRVLKRRLFKDGLKLKICEECGLEMWQNQPIPLEIHHIDGDRTNNCVDNLMILCPNCHALTDTYRGKNINKGVCPNQV